MNCSASIFPTEMRLTDSFSRNCNNQHAHASAYIDNSGSGDQFMPLHHMLCIGRGISNAVETGLKAFWVTLISARIITSAKASHSFRKFDHSIIKLARIESENADVLVAGKERGGGGGGGGHRQLCKCRLMKDF